MQVIYSPVLPPGCCFICRASSRDSYIDTDVSKDYEGAFYICNQCVSEMAVMYSYLSFDEYKNLRSAKEDLERMNFELIKRVGQLEEVHDALARAGYKYDGDVVRLGGYSSASNENDAKGTSGAEDSMGIGEGKTTQSLHDEGVDELHSDEQSIADEFSLDL